MQFKQKSSKNLLYGLKSRYNNDMSKSTPNMKINSNLEIEYNKKIIADKVLKLISK